MTNLTSKHTVGKKGKRLSQVHKVSSDLGFKF